MTSRRKIAAGVFGSALALGAFTVPTVASAAHQQAQANLGDLLRTKVPGQLLSNRGGTMQTSNWAGYAVNARRKNVTAVNSTFTVPRLGGCSGIQAIWTGIGGATGSTTLIQAGVSESSLPMHLGLSSAYESWYELIPAGPVQLSHCRGRVRSCAPSPGDRITVNIKRLRHGVWSIKLADAGKWSYAKTVHYISDDSSAEWINEAPSMSVAGLPSTVPGTAPVRFSPRNTYVTAGRTHTIAYGHPDKLISSPAGLGALVPNALTMSMPSRLARNGQSFNICNFANSCPTP